MYEITKDLNFCIREWLSNSLGISKEKIIIANQNKKLPAPPFIWLHLVTNIERLGWDIVEYTNDNKEKRVNIFKVNSSIEFIGFDILSNPVIKAINELEYYSDIFHSKNIGVIRDSLNLLNIPNYFEETNEITKHILDISFYINGEVEKEFIPTQRIRYEIETQNTNGNAGDFPIVNVEIKTFPNITTIPTITNVIINITNITSSGATITCI
jgi:hypothetical protein